MPKWVQRINEDGTSRFVPVGEDHATSRMAAPAVFGDLESFVSPVDGTVISDRKQLREHNKRNNVVNTAEFDGEHVRKRQQERERVLAGKHTPAEKFARKQELYERITQTEQNNG